MALPNVLKSVRVDLAVNFLPTTSITVQYGVGMIRMSFDFNSRCGSSGDGQESDGNRQRFVMVICNDCFIHELLSACG